MSRMTKVIIGAVVAGLAVGGLFFLLGMPSNAEVTPTTPTTVDRGKIGSTEVQPNGGLPADIRGHTGP